MHHIISDGWSLGVLSHETMTLYQSFSTGKPSPLPDLPVQYADFAQWQRQWLQGAPLERQLSYWRQQLDGAPSFLELPTDRPRKAAPRSEGRIERATLPRVLADGLRKLGNDTGATLFMTLLAAFEVLLSRYTGQADIVVGSPIAGRTRPEIEGLIGFFVNTVVMRGDLSGNPSFREFPLTPNGKLDRNALPEPDATRPDLEEAYVNPRTETEELLAGIWREVLGLEQVDIHDNFFELGGHSLLATQVISRLREAFAAEIPLRTLFLAPTVSGLAEQIDDARNKRTGLEVPRIAPAPRDRELLLSFSQEREWLLDRLEPGTSAYNLRHTMRLGGPLQRKALGQSLTGIVRRHESLRTIFPSRNDRPVQVILPAPTLVLPVIDLSSLPEPPREVEMHRLVQAEARTSFDLARGPLFCCLLIELSEEDRVLSVTMHHIVTDDWSMGIFSRELWALYEAWVRGEPSPLSKLALQYADYAQWQRRLLSGPTLENLVSYWKNQLRDAPPLLELPTDHPRPRVQAFRGAYIGFSLASSLGEAIKVFCYQEGATPFMTLLSGFKALLYSYTAQERINVGTFIANRNRAEIEPLIGFFVNNLVLLTDLSGDPSFHELLRRVRTVTLDAYPTRISPLRSSSKNRIRFAIPVTPLCFRSCS